MKRKVMMSVMAFSLLWLTACATTTVTPSRTYYEAQQVYINAWNAYHMVWLAIPETDARKVGWVKEYHPKFAKAADLLQSWSGAINDPTWATATNQAVDTITQILIELAIKKGGTQ